MTICITDYLKTFHLPHQVSTACHVPNPEKQTDDNARREEEMAAKSDKKEEQRGPQRGNEGTARGEEDYDGYGRPVTGRGQQQYDDTTQHPNQAAGWNDRKTGTVGTGAIFLQWAFLAMHFFDSPPPLLFL